MLAAGDGMRGEGERGEEEPGAQDHGGRDVDPAEIGDRCQHERADDEGDGVADHLAGGLGDGGDGRQHRHVGGPVVVGVADRQRPEVWRRPEEHREEQDHRRPPERVGDRGPADEHRDGAGGPPDHDVVAAGALQPQRVHADVERGRRRGQQRRRAGWHPTTARRRPPPRAPSANTSAWRGWMTPVTSGRPWVRCILASMSRSTYMLMALAPPAASVPPRSVSSTRPRLGQPRSASTIVGTVVISSSSMIRGLVERDVRADHRARCAQVAVRPLQRAARRQPGRDEWTAADGHNGHTLRTGGNPAGNPLPRAIGGHPGGGG